MTIPDTNPSVPQINYAKALGIENPEQYSRQTLKELISKKVEEQEKVEAEPKVSIKKPDMASKNGNNGNKAMYVSYAKDIFIALVNRLSDEGYLQMGEKEVDATMRTSIELVKQAKEAFE